MQMPYFCILGLLAALSYTPFAQARISCFLTQTPLSLGSFDPAQSEVAKLSPNGRLFGQIDELGNARIWALDSPAFPLLELFSNASRGEFFVDISFSADNRYIIFDGSLTNTSLPIHGRIIVFSTDTFQQQAFNSYVWGGTSRSKFALSNTGLFAYVPDHDGHRIVIIDLATKRRHEIADRDFCSISALAFDPSAKRLAIKDTCAEALRIRDINTGQLLRTLPLSSPMPDDEFSSDQTLFFWGQGSMLAVNSDQNEFAVGLDAKTGAGQFPFMWFMPLAMFQSNDTKILAIADETFSLNIQILNDPMLYIIQPFAFSFVLAGAFSSGDKVLALGSSQGEIAIYDAKLNFQCSSVLTQPQGILQIAFVSEQRFFSLSDENTLIRWELHN